MDRGHACIRPRLRGWYALDLPTGDPRPRSVKYEEAPDLSINDYSYKLLTFDSRSYVEFSYQSKISFASRFYGGTSWGDDRKTFLIGGTPWIFSSEGSWGDFGDPNHQFEDQYVLPIRGHTLGSKSGENVLLMNYELRLPFLMYYIPTIKFLGQIFGVIFVDVGVVWNNPDPDCPADELCGFPQCSDNNNWGETVDGSGWLMSCGFGPRFILFGMPWKLDYAWKYTPRTGIQKDRLWYLSIGFDF